MKTKTQQKGLRVLLRYIVAATEICKTPQLSADSVQIETHTQDDGESSENIKYKHTQKMMEKAQKI